MSPLRAALAILFALSVTACDEPTAVAERPSGDVSVTTLVVTVANGVVTVRNATADTVSYRIVESGTLALALFAPCTVSSCPTLRPGEERRVPYRDITGWSPTAREAILSWWRMVPGRDGTLVPVAGGDGLRITL